MCVRVGCGSVGKTALLQQYVHRRYTASYKTTIGVRCYGDAMDTRGGNDDGVPPQVDFLTAEVPVGDGPPVAVQVCRCLCMCALLVECT
jgi:hypothetical protein